MTKREKNAYLAAIVDGEGTITINHHRQYKRETYQYKPYIYVSNTNKQLMDFIVKEYGGVYKLLENKRIYYRWRVMSLADIERVLKIIFPYLIVKKKQATVLMRYLETRKQKIKVNKNAPYSKVEKQCYLKIKKLNSSGMS